MTESKQGVLIIDFGSQYTQLITRRVREQSVFSEIVPHSISVKEVEKLSPVALILSGGPSSVYADNPLTFAEGIIDLGIPILGICYGMQLLINHFGGTVQASGRGEYGFSTIQPHANSRLLSGISEETQVWMSHGDIVDKIPENWRVTARSSNGMVAAIEHRTRPLYGTQFHPEVVHTVEGRKILSNFLFKLVKCEANWTPGIFIEEVIPQIKKQIKNGKVICGVSGGVDSAVVAKLIHLAVGNRLRAVFIDHGLLRKHEKWYVINNLSKTLGFPIEYHDFSEIFLTELEGIINPEDKRTIIGKQFIYAFESIVGEENIEFLAQGTLYPDVIESGGRMGTADIIKTHHNVGGLPDDVPFKLIEPLRELFKDEVRQVGKELGIPGEVLNRHPFPGPGLAVRIMGEVTSERLHILREADDLYISLLKEYNIYDEIWQAFCVLIPIKTVGVMGDQRTYGNLLALRAVTSTDGMTADWYRMPQDILGDIANKIVNSVKGINRVVYDISSKPPGTIEWE